MLMLLGAVSAFAPSASQARDTSRAASDFPNPTVISRVVSGLPGVSEAVNAFLLPPPKQRDSPANELFGMLAEQFRSGVECDKMRALSLVEDLIAEGGSFNPALLGGGLWLSVSSYGPQPKWARNAALLGGLVQNKVGQIFDPYECTVCNYGEIAGSNCFVVAEGTFTVPRNQKRCPVDIPVDIAKGALHVRGLRVGLGIKGSAVLRVRYLDDKLRIFESVQNSPDTWEESGTLVVQIRQNTLIMESEDTLVNRYLDKIWVDEA